jgi:hypothetical protein
LVVDSTGLKIYGEGEWKVRQHGVGKRRVNQHPNLTSKKRRKLSR